MIISTFENIDQLQWKNLIDGSSTATWFQTVAAYKFFAAQPDLFAPFVVAVSREEPLSLTTLPYHSPSSPSLAGLCMGYVTREKSAVKQFLTRRAIIIGGPVLADDITDEELRALLNALKNTLHSPSPLSLSLSPIYIETRNFNDYSRHKAVFQECGFAYQPHLNFHVDTTSWERVEENIGKHRKKYIRLSYRDGATVVENPSLAQVREYYDLLLHLYQTKVKTPLQPWSFFERLFCCADCRYILVQFEGKIVGGSVCMLLPGHGVYEWFACGNDGLYKNIYPSSVTKHAGMKFAADNGYPLFDMMGAGKPDEEYGVRDFKAEFGGTLVEHGRFLCVCKPLLYKIGVLGVKILKRKKG